MPNIQEYTNPIDGVKPSEQGIEAAVQAGRRIGTFYHQIGEEVGGGVTSLGDQYQQHQDQQQVIDHTTARSQVDLNLYKQWDDFKNDPQWKDSPAAAEAFIDTVVRPAYSGLTQHVANPKIREALADQDTQRVTEMGRYVIGEQKEIDASRAVDGVRTVITSAAAQAAVGANPDAARQQAYTDVDAISSSIQDPEKRQTFLTEHHAIIDKQIANGYYYGLIHSYNPNAPDQAAEIDRVEQNLDLADRQLKAGYLADGLGDRAGEFAAQIDQTRAALIADKTRGQEQAKKAFDDNSKAVASDYLTGIGSGGNGPALATRALTDPRLNDADKRAIADFAIDYPKKLQEGDPVVQNKNYRALIGQVASGKTFSVAQVLASVGPNGISHEQADDILKLQKPELAPGDRSMLDTNKEAWVKTLSRPKTVMGAPDPEGSQDIVAATNYYMPLAVAKLGAGVPAAQVFDISGKDPNSIYHGRPIESFKSGRAVPPNQPHPAAGGKKLTDSQVMGMFK